MVVRWTFEDLTTLEQYEFEINPNEHQLPARRKKMTTEDTSAPDGRTILFEGRREVQKMTFSGVFLTQDQFEAFDEWFEKPYQIRMTDDRGQIWWIYLESWEPTRQRAVHYPWKHQYSMTAYILDWPA